MVSVRRRPKSRVPSPNSKAPTSPNSDVPAKPSSEVQAHRSQSSAQRSQPTQAQTSPPNSEATAQKSPNFAVLERAHVVRKRFAAFVAAELTRVTGDHELTRLWAAAPGGHGLKKRFAMHSFGHVRKYRGLPWQRHARISFNWQRLHKRVGQQGVCSAALSTRRGYARSWSRPVVLDGFRYAVEAQLCLWLRYGGPLASPSREGGNGARRGVRRGSWASRRHLLGSLGRT